MPPTLSPTILPTLIPTTLTREPTIKTLSILPSKPDNITVLNFKFILLIIFCLIGCCISSLCTIILAILIKKNIKSKKDIKNLSNIAAVNCQPSLPSIIPPVITTPNINVQYSDTDPNTSYDGKTETIIPNHTNNNITDNIAEGIVRNDPQISNNTQNISSTNEGSV